MSWERELGVKADLINGALELLLPPASAYPSSIHEAMRYSTFAGGKRLRGSFVIAVAEMFGTEGERVLPAACALEMIHTYSLIHDDLPAMDDDDYRRGKPTCHKVFGEALAILAGDALLTLAFAALSQLPEQGCESGAVLRVIREASQAAGSRGLIGGQVVDLDSEGVRVTKETLEYIHNHKTGALFSAAVKCGALLSGAADRELRALAEYARAFGLAFQITDDLLDLSGDQELLGKMPGSDLAKEKATFPAILGISEAGRLAEEQVRKCQLSIACFGKRADFLSGAADYLLTRRV